MRISVRIDSAAAQAQLRRRGGKFRTKVHQPVARAIARDIVRPSSSKLMDSAKKTTMNQKAPGRLVPATLLRCSASS